jgi:multicomponent Na+:H+ antiporter subunit D
MMNFANWTLIWLALPFISGFVIYLLPKIDRHLTMTTLLLTIIYPIWVLLTGVDFTITLKDNFGVSLMIDGLSGYLILTNCLVTIAVTCYCWQQEKKSFFYAIMMILYGSVNTCFIVNDLISFYVALEVISIAAFLLIVYPRTNFSIWVGLRYLLISNTAMLFYLVGAILEYQAHHSFKFQVIEDSQPEAIALIVVALLVKGGIFVSGLWLPLTHASVETPVSALLSGIVIKTGIYPLIRLTLLMDEMDWVIGIFAITTAIFGVSYAIFEKDVKRMLAFHTISQLGFVLATPAAAGIYALSHGLVKSSLFLMAGALPSRNLKELQHLNISRSLWLSLTLASLSIAGMPFLAGFVTKTLTLKGLTSWQLIIMNVAAVGTAISFAKFIFLPHSSEEKTEQDRGFWLAVIFLLCGLVASNLIYPSAYTISNILKSLITIAIGWTIYLLIIKKIVVYLPRGLEKIDNLIGFMSLTLVGLFWLVIPSI